MALLQTVLHAQHQQAGAKMVDFGGWEMPLHYGSQLQEHNTVREKCGMFDVSHMTILDVAGKDSLAFLRYVLANDVAKLTLPGQALYSCLLNSQGGVIDDLIVYYLAEQQYRLVVNCGTCAKDIQWLTTQAAKFAVTLKHNTDKAIIAIQGPTAIATVLKILSAKQSAVAALLTPFTCCYCDDWLIAYTGYTGEAGFEIMLPQQQAVVFWQALLAAGVQPCGLGARDTLRLEAGMNLYGTDMDDSVSPLEAGLGWTIDTRDAQRDFIGKAALVAQKAAGVQYKFVGLLLESKGVLRNGLTVVLDEKRTGRITSGGFSPTLNKGIALARVPLDIGTHCEVEVRGKLLPVRVVKTSFVRHGQCLV